jgi:hypothetical protein
MKKITQQFDKVCNGIMNLSNSELKNLRVVLEREIILSEMCIKEGTEKRQ